METATVGRDFFFSSRRRHTRYWRDWSSDVCSSDLLKDIWLSFYPGAKIGVVGANGSGKSSLLRIMAGLDKDFNGEAWPAEGTRISYLPQEPELDPALDVRGNVEEAVKAQRELLRRFEEVNMSFGEPDADFDALLEEQARLQDQIDAGN